MPIDTHRGWTFLSNHGHVLLCIARNPDARVRDIAAQVGITDRAVQRILAELEEAHVLVRERRGRRTHYAIEATAHLRHPLEAHRSVSDLVRLVELDE
ncbi:MAG: winged helix-turn-helix transcriptional regulator [Myxococcales bacterium]|nr:winged helix-turn-helix transcriptional regulator [Myxococcales bacterium]MCB9630499.1 winged helix-turn-helix transcriptional regulator [Sandaracinaceae bacterium]